MHEIQFDFFGINPFIFEKQIITRLRIAHRLQHQGTVDIKVIIQCQRRCDLGAEEHIGAVIVIIR